MRKARKKPSETSPRPNPSKESPRRAAQFDPLVLDKAIIAIPLLRELRRESEEHQELQAAAKKLRPRPGELVFGADLNPLYPGSVILAREALEGLIEEHGGRCYLPPKNSPVRDRCLCAVLTRSAFDAIHAAPQDRSPLDPPAPFSRTWWEFPRQHPVIIDLNLEYPGGRAAAQKFILDRVHELFEPGVTHDSEAAGFPESQYVFADLTRDMIFKLLEADRQNHRGQPRAIFRIWPDFPVQMLLTKSASTIKADAARNSFGTWGAEITWAVIDSGIDGNHPHFAEHDNLGRSDKSKLPKHFHRDFTGEGDPFRDERGHGTHVAGIIAGESLPKKDRVLRAVRRTFTEEGDERYHVEELTQGISGIAPKCRLVSLKVIDQHGNGAVSKLIMALQHVQQINGYGRRILIHGVNISLGYTFEPEWFACGQSPVCVEVDRLVKSGVVVVVAAGNTGYGSVQTEFVGVKPAGLDVTINDPGNAERAITVGSTHRDMPHTYGVSYFSSKGPTGDGRAKPDLVAPGEKIVSCATGALLNEGAGPKRRQCDYVETSGTSMAAPHVSGAIAAFLSVRREFIEQPEKVKAIFAASATDLRRDKYFQGAGLVDLMRAIQSV